jgi:hypothetical protein
MGDDALKHAGFHRLRPGLNDLANARFICSGWLHVDSFRLWMAP